MLRLRRPPPDSLGEALIENSQFAHTLAYSLGPLRPNPGKSSETPSRSGGGIYLSRVKRAFRPARLQSVFACGPAWTRTRDLFLIRDNCICCERLLLFKNTCKSLLFPSTVILYVHCCSGALSSNCRQMPRLRHLIPSTLMLIGLHGDSRFIQKKRSRTWLAPIRPGSFNGTAWRCRSFGTGA